MTATVAPSELYPSILSFLTSNGLVNTAKKFQKEAGEVQGEEYDLIELVRLAQESTGAKLGKKKKKQRPLEEAAEEAVEAPEVPAEAAPQGKKKKKRVAEEAVVEEAAAEEEEQQPAAEEPPLKKKKKKARPQDEEAGEEEAAEEPKAEEAKETETTPVAKTNGKVKEKRTQGTPFQREDWSKWESKIQDARLKDNTHQAKAKYGGSAGDSWGDKAAADMIQVKGRGFRKEMQKKKRASWRGTGQLDQGINSIKFDSDSE